MHTIKYVASACYYSTVPQKNRISSHWCLFVVWAFLFTEYGIWLTDNSFFLEWKMERELVFALERRNFSMVVNNRIGTFRFLFPSSIENVSQHIIISAIVYISILLLRRKIRNIAYGLPFGIAVLRAALMY